MESVDAVVIGGGCVGASILYHLAELGWSNTVLVEKEALAAGSTSKSAGGIRLQHSGEVNARLALRSLGEFERFEELTGVPIGFEQVGYLMLYDNESDFAEFAAFTDAQSGLGIPTEILSGDEAGGMVPGLTTRDVVGATFCPLEGYASPESVVQGYAQAARRRGAAVRIGSKATSIVAESGRVTGIETSTGPIAADVVVIAAGVASGELAGPLDFELPVSGMARTIFFSSNSGGVPDGSPLVVDFSTGFYFHREGPGLLFAGRQAEPELLAVPAVHRLPAVADISINSSWWGYYDMSPDRSAMIGRAPVEGLFYATGFSGHGFMQSPAVGEHIAQIIDGHEPTLDLGSLAADRFALGQPQSERVVI